MMEIDILEISFLLLFGGAMVGFSIFNRRRQGAYIRHLPAFTRLRRAIDLAVEDGTRTHVALGHADITSANSAAALVGLSMLQRITQIAADSDQPPVATAGDGSLALVAQDALRGSYQSMGALNNYNHSLGRAAGLTPFSYAAATIPIIRSEGVSANLLVGTFGSEVALITSAGSGKRVLTLAGTDNLPAQAILFATADEQLIGEELYAGGAYIDAGPMHIASLHAQDVIRLLLIFVIILSTLGGLLSAS
jgi:hypothetical protein